MRSEQFAGLPSWETTFREVQEEAVTVELAVEAAAIVATCSQPVVEEAGTVSPQIVERRVCVLRRGGNIHPHFRGGSSFGPRD